MKVKMKLADFQQNVATFNAVDQPEASESLQPSGRRDYGQISVLVSEESAVKELVIGNVYTVSIDADDVETDEELGDFPE